MQHKTYDHSVKGSENQTITLVIAITQVDSTTNGRYFPTIKAILKPFRLHGSSKLVLSFKCHWN